MVDKLPSIEELAKLSVLPMNGENVSVPCFFDESHRVIVPLYIFDRNKKSWFYEKYGEVRDEFREKDIENGAHISGCNMIYCSRKCHSLYCED